MTTINSNYISSQLFGQSLNNTSNTANTAAARSRSLTSGYGSVSTGNSMQAQILSQMLGSMGIGSNDSMSFAELLGLRSDVQSSFEATVRSDLREAGVGLDKKAYQEVRGAAFNMELKAKLEKEGITGQYSLESDGAGGVNVVGADEETRIAIEEYLAKNPDVVKEFNKIKNPSRKDMLEYRDEMEEDFEKMLRDFLKEEGLSSKASINLKSTSSGVTVDSSDAKVKSALQKLFKDKPELAQQYKDIESLTDTDSVKFQLTFDKQGKPVVVSNHPDKDLIQNYFDNNPSSVKQFQQIDSLTNLDQARKAQKVNVSDIRKRIQLESMSTWFASTGMGASSIMDFTGGTSALINGLNKVA